MPLVKQGKYKEYYNKCKNVQKEMEECHNRYFDENGIYNPSYDVCSDFSYSIDQIYREATATKRGLEGLIEFSEQKTEKSIKQCKMRINEMESVISKCVDDFRSVCESFNNDFTDAERDTFDSLEITKEM